MSLKSEAAAPLEGMLNGALQLFCGLKITSLGILDDTSFRPFSSIFKLFTKKLFSGI